jgi:hypothetical protein
VLYSSDAFPGRIYKLSLDGKVLGVFGKSGKQLGHTFSYIPPGKYQVTPYFEPDSQGGELKPFPEAAKWRAVRQEVVVRGDTEIVVHLEPANPN